MVCLRWVYPLRVWSYKARALEIHESKIEPLALRLSHMKIHPFGRLCELSNQNMKIQSLHLFPFALACASCLTAQPPAQPVDDTQLKQVIIFGRHSVRAAVAPNTYLDQYSTQQFPNFDVAAGILTPNGEQLETILGGYYREWLTQEGLLTGNDTADANFVFFHANSIQRTIDTAQHLWMGMLPGAPVNVQYLAPSTAADPLFEPVGAGVAQLNSQMATDSVMGHLGSNPESLVSAYSPEIALSRSVLLGYPSGETPAPLAPANVTDATDFIDVGGVSQTSRIINLVTDLKFRTPHIARVESSNVASQIVRTMVQSATGNAMTGTLGTPSTKIVALIASDVNICGFAGLFHIDWPLPEYQQDFCSPGGAMVFQLRQSQSTGEYIVRASYIGQTLDQLRDQTILSMDVPPAIAPVSIPNCSIDNATFDCPLGELVRIANELMDPHSADLVN